MAESESPNAQYEGSRMADDMSPNAQYMSKRSHPCSDHSTAITLF